MAEHTLQRQDLDPLLALVVGAVAVGASLALWWGEPSRAVEASDPAVAELDAQGEAVRRRPRGQLAWQSLPPGAPLRAGDSLFVPPGGQARVLFFDGSRLDLEGNTLVALEAPTTAGAGRLRLDRGEGILHSGPRGLSVGSGFGGAYLPSGSLARVASFEGTGEVEVLSGAAQLADGTRLSARDSARGAEGSWHRNQAWPLALASPPPGVRRYFAGSAPPPVELTWHPAAPRGARLRVWRGASEDAPLLDLPAREGTAQLALPGPGSYMWRLTDARGAPLSEGRRLHLVRDAAPVPVSPLQAEVIHGYLGRKVPLGWSGVPGVRTYQVEVATGPDFSVPALRRQVEGLSLHLGDELADGRYHWRVRAHAPEERGASPWSPPGAFRFLTRPVPDAPELLDAQLELEPER